MENRTETLTALLKYDRNLKEISSKLKNYEWDSDEELVTIKKEHVQKILERFLASELSAENVEEWANLVEGRDDISFSNEILTDTIFELANPLLTEELTKLRAEQLIKSKIMNN